ncbi:MAG: hypothetical protein ACTHKG_21295 [Nocardioides sp.]
MSASADVIYNEIDTSIDTKHELMELVVGGPDGSTNLSVLIEGQPGGGKPDEHPGCDINGTHKVTLQSHVAPAGAVQVTLSNGGVIDDCADKVHVTVHPLSLSVGQTATVTFTGDENTSKDPKLDIEYEQAAFDVTLVNAADGGDGTRCDGDPAAPAWARALLKGNGLKAKVPGEDNYVKSVAKHMGKGATFDGYAKSSQSYPYLVEQYLEGLLGDQLANGPDEVRKPGWRCTPLPTS